MRSKVFFSERVIDVWNGLSDSVHVNFSSLVKFKSYNNSFSFSDYLEFNWLD